MQLSHPQLQILAREIFAFCLAVYQHPGTGRLLVLYGPNGCGKTHAARRVYHWFNRVRMQLGSLLYLGGEEPQVKFVEAVFCNWAEVVDGIKLEQWLIFDRLMHECLVILDDIGAEHDPSGIGREKLYTILNRRETRPTLVTTNVAPGDWPRKFENRIASRLFRNSVHVDLTQVPDFYA